MGLSSVYIEAPEGVYSGYTPESMFVVSLLAMGRTPMAIVRNPLRVGIVARVPSEPLGQGTVREACGLQPWEACGLQPWAPEVPVSPV